MKALIMTNGEYAADVNWYRSRVKQYQLIICVDGGAGQALKMDILPHVLVGDMDSIGEEDCLRLKESGVRIHRYPSEKDFTDTQLAMDYAESEGCKSLTIWGGTGSRLDHTLANLLSVGYFAEKGMEIRFESPLLTIHFVKGRLPLCGNIGDTVSVLALGEQASGVSLSGFKYPLDNVILKANHPIGVSNVITGDKPLICVKEGILAVFHNLGAV